MNILESYSLQSGLKISRPFIMDNFFPSNLGKYITFHSHSKFDSRNYSYLQEVISLLNKALKQNGISIVQLGLASDPEIPGSIDFRNKCNVNQTAYMISKSMAHFGVDSFLLHLAAHYNVPFVGLYSNMYKEQSMPLWGDRKQQVHLESAKGKNKPTYAPQENPKTINTIMPEEVVNSVISLISHEEKLKKINESTIFIGKDFKNSIIEIIPDFITEQDFLRGTMVNLRLDLAPDHSALPHWMQDREVNLITDKPLDSQMLNKARGNIKMINIDLTGAATGKNTARFTNGYIKSLKSFIPNINLFVRDKKELSKTRLMYFDWEVNLFNLSSKNNLDNQELVCDNTFYKSSKSFISKGKQYQSISAWKKGIEYNGQPQEVIDDDIFWEDLSYYRLFNKE